MQGAPAWRACPRGRAGCWCVEDHSACLFARVELHNLAVVAAAQPLTSTAAEQECAIRDLEANYLGCRCLCL